MPLGERIFDNFDVVGWVQDLSLAIAIPVAVVGFLVAFLLLGAVFSVLGYLITNWNFTLSRDARGRSFHVRRGLLTSTETSLERERVRGLEVIEPLGLRLVGAARLAAIVTGVSGSESSRSQLVPPAPRGVIDATGAEVLELSEPLHLPLTRHGACRAAAQVHARAAGRARTASGGQSPSPSPRPLTGGWCCRPCSAYRSRCGSPPTATAGSDTASARDISWSARGACVGGATCSSARGSSAGTSQQSWFQRRAGLVTLVATTAAGHQAYAAIDIPED